MLRRHLLLAMAGLLTCAATPAERRTVLSQIDLPHNYYFREMYLPQLTSGPSGVAFTPDGRSLIYSMQGRLWQQRLDSTTAVQLTAGPGYDYQPDVSPDGKQVAFTRYLGDALELQVLELATGQSHPLTTDGAVNCEPRWSPDGTRIAWVSTFGSGHFRIFAGTLIGGKLAGQALWPERKSTTPRYYYSAYDHELSPSWSPDGKELAYVGNPEAIYGTGPIWRRGLERDSAPQLLRQEETTWRARPDWSPDGKRIVFASYAGRNWHQLWITTAAGNGDPLPLSYGEYDATGARWARDGQLIAYLGNSGGDTEIHVLDIPGARDRVLAIRDRRYLKPMGRLVLHIAAATGNANANVSLIADSAELPVRVSVLASDGRAYAPDDAWMHADDGFDRTAAPFESHYFHSLNGAALTLPPGPAKITVWRGLATLIARREVIIRAAETTDERITLEPLALPADWRATWHSADVHVHMNYGGVYRNSPAHLLSQAAAEDLDLVFNLIVNKEQRVPDIRYFAAKPDPASTSRVLLAHAQEFHTSYWGHLGLLGLNDHYLSPGFAAYANTAAASPYPTNAVVADLAHAQGALVGYVHPFDTTPDPAHDATLTSELPVDVALGKVDYYEVVGFSDHLASAGVWHRLLNCGFRASAAAGTDAMADYASLHGPVGLSRVYVQDGAREAGPSVAISLQAREDGWLAGLKAGHSMATNSALLGLEVDGKPPGSVLELPTRGATLQLRGFMRSIVPMDHLEVLQNGKVIRAIRLQGDRRSADLDEQVHATETGWILLRAWNEHADPDIFDIYPYATTNPVFLTQGNTRRQCGADADYFIAWIDRLSAAARAHPGYNTEVERQLTLAQIAAARKEFERRR